MLNMENCPQHTPVLNSLGDTMRCGLFTNDKADILLVHYEELAGDVDYIQYDPAVQKFSLIFENGQMQELGLTMQDRIDANLRNGADVTIARMKDKKFVSTQKVVFLIQTN
ncbi:MAG: hypothetical protein AAGB32_04820 [Pseudomonadota bacterium]